MMYANFEKVVAYCKNEATTEKLQISSSLQEGVFKDLKAQTVVLQKYYQQDFENMVQEQKSLFDKYELIAANYPELLKDRDFLCFLYDVFVSGCLPHPIVYCQARLICEADMVEEAVLYLQDKDVRNWIIKHWAVCSPIKYIIHCNLKKKKINDEKLSKLSNSHYGVKFWVVFVLLVLETYFQIGGSLEFSLILWGLFFFLFGVEALLNWRLHHHYTKKMLKKEE